MSRTSLRKSNHVFSHLNSFRLQRITEINLAFGPPYFFRSEIGLRGHPAGRSFLCQLRNRMDLTSTLPLRLSALHYAISILAAICCMALGKVKCLQAGYHEADAPDRSVFEPFPFLRGATALTRCGHYACFS